MPAPRQFADATAWQIGKPDIVVKFPAYAVRPRARISFGDLLRRHPDRRGPLHQGDSDARSATRGRTRSCTTRCPTRSTIRTRRERRRQPWRRRRTVPRRVRLGQERRGLSGWIGRAAPEGARRRCVSYHLHSIGEEIEAGVELGIMLYPEGLHAEAHPLVAAARAADDAARHSGRHRGAQRRLHHPPQAGAPHRVPAAHAQPRQTPVPRADLPDVGHAARRPRSSTARTSTTTGISRTTTRTMRSRCARRHHPAQHPVARQHAGQSARADPKNWVGDGQRTIDEMGFFWIGWVELTDEEYKTQLAERKAAQQRMNRRRPAAAAAVGSCHGVASNSFDSRPARRS